MEGTKSIIGPLYAPSCLLKPAERKQQSNFHQWKMKNEKQKKWRASDVANSSMKPIRFIMYYVSSIRTAHSGILMDREGQSKHGINTATNANNKRKRNEKKCVYS